MRWIFYTSINFMSCYYKIRFHGFENIRNKLLRISINYWEPTTLYLNHHLMSGFQIRDRLSANQFCIHKLYPVLLAGLDVTISKSTPKNVISNHKLISAHFSSSESKLPERHQLVLQPNPHLFRLLTQKYLPISFQLR